MPHLRLPYQLCFRRSAHAIATAGAWKATCSYTSNNDPDWLMNKSLYDNQFASQEVGGYLLPSMGIQDIQMYPYATNFHNISELLQSNFE